MRSPDHPATRVLAVLELLQTYGRINGAELASRLAVDRRTIRRYIALLEEIGIPITAARGPEGGYELVPGFKLPPLMFTNDEAMALALGLVAVRGYGLANSAPAVAGAQAKLERVMPANLKGRVQSVSESVAFAHPRQSNPGDSSVLSALSAAAHSRLGVNLRYRALSGEQTERGFDPYGLAYSSGRWYVAGHCHLRNGLRTFRVDRVDSVEPQSRPFQRPAKFDIIAHLTTSIATLPRKFSIEVHFQTNLESARRELFPSIGILEPAPVGVLLRAQADDLDWFARELARLPWSFEIAKPAQLRSAVAKHARALLRQARI